MANRVYTIGHSTRTFDEVLSMLREHGITHLVDVRSYPASRTFPQWNQDAIVDALPPAVPYRWIRELGGRRHTPKGVESVNTAWRVKAFRDYADHMMSDEFTKGLDELLDLAAHGRPVIMCSEAVPWRCHRRLITDALIVAGTDVVHIMSAAAAKPASLNENAVVRDGRVTYPAPWVREMSTDIVAEVREAVAAIPAGGVASYGDIAERIGTGPRQVGRAMGLLDDGVPWWRVVHADGTPATCHQGQAPRLLAEEGTPMRGTRVDMRRARHRGRAPLPPSP